MKKVYPVYPKPSKYKATTLKIFFKQRHSWLDALYVKSYTMKLGQVTLPSGTMYMANQPELIHKILVDDVKSFPKNAFMHELLKPVLGESIFTTNGNVWKKQRELLNPSFSMVLVSKVFPKMYQASLDMVDRLDTMTDHFINIDHEMTYVTADIIFRTILSEKLDPEKGKKILEAFVFFQEQCARTAINKLLRIPEWATFFNKEKERLAAGEFIRNSLAEIIKPRYDNKDNSDGFQDILASLLKVKDEDTNQPFSFEEILSQIAMLFLAGHETTASSLTWAIYLLALYPEHQERAYREVMEVCGNDEFTIENTQSLTFVTNIFKETLRLYPPVGFFAREAAHDLNLRGKNIKKGSIVLVAPWLIQRSSEFWEDPHMFDPDRFDESRKIAKNTYFPFGMGQRVCIGYSFGMQEAILLIATMVRNYSIELEEGFVPEIAGRLTIRSLNGVSVKLRKRT